MNKSVFTFCFTALLLQACSPTLRSVQESANKGELPKSEAADVKVENEGPLPEIEVLDYEFEKKGSALKHGIDEFLNLQFTRTVLLSLNVEMKKPSEKSPTGYLTEKLQPGTYKVKWALLASGAEQLDNLKGQIIDFGQEKVTIHNSSSSLNFPIKWNIQDYRGISHTSVFVVQVLPENKDKASFAKTVFKSFLLASNEKESSNFEPITPQSDERGIDFFDQVNTQSLNDNHQRAVELLRRSDKNVVAKEENLRLVNLNSEADLLQIEEEIKRPRSHIPQFRNEAIRYTNMTRPELRMSLAARIHSKEWADRLCTLWFHRILPLVEANTNQLIFKMSGGSQYNLAANCASKARKNLKDYFQIQTVQFVRQATMKSVARASIQDFKISSEFSVADGRDEKTEWNWSASVGMKVPLKIVSMGAGTEIKGSRSHNRSSDRSNSFSAGSEMTIESLKIEVDAKTSEQCTVIRLHPKVYSGEKAFLGDYLNPKISAQTRFDLFRRGLMVCDGQQVTPKNSMTEDYYIVNQNASEQILDSNSNLGHPFFAVIRGKNELNRFLMYLQTKIKLPDDPQADDFSNTLEDLFMVKLPSYPSQISR